MILTIALFVCPTTGDLVGAASWDALKALCMQALGLDPETHQVDCVQVERGQGMEPEVVTDLSGDETFHDVLPLNAPFLIDTVAAKASLDSVIV
jgi:hypothetical protein